VPPRSVAKTKAESGDWRRSSRSARTSSPRSGCALGLPFLARRTCSVASRLSSTCDHPADTTGPRSINVYLFEVRDFSAEAVGGADAKRFKIEPQRLLYSLQRLHNGTPPDFQLQLAR
jgi:hypothetical protein